MDPIEEILNLRELVIRLSNRVAALESSSSKKIELVKCSKCGVERHPLFKRQCLDPECEGGLTIGAYPPKSPMTSEPCHGLDIENMNQILSKSSTFDIDRAEREKYHKGVGELTQYWRDNPEKAPKY